VITLNYAGTLLATASVKGTLIRIFSTDTGNPLSEVRRGQKEAVIYSLSFDMKSQWLACSSDRNTIHLFSVDVKMDNPNGIKLQDENAKVDEKVEDDEHDRPKNKQSKLGIFKGIISYFGGEWSYGRFKVPGDSVH
jgi:WD40 repeat protein